MAEVQTVQNIPAPFIEAGGKTFLDMLTSAVGQYGSADLSKIFGSQFVAGQDPLQAQAQQLATQGIGAYKPFLQAAAASTGPGAYKQFMSPYQQDIIDTTMADFDVQAQKGAQGVPAAAIAAGAFGGGREGVMQAQYMNQGAMDRAALQAQLLNQGFMQAQQAAGTDLAARQGLGQYQQALGQADQGFEQAKLDAQTLANREKEFEEFTRLGLVRQQLSQIQPGAFPTTTIVYQQSAAPASPMASFLGGAAGAGGVLGKLGIFG